MQQATSVDVIFIGGRSGVGKTTVAAEVSRQLALVDVAHALIEGDNLDQAHPEPWREGIDLAEQNLAAMWRNYQAAGYSRLIFTNTVSVLQMPALIAALATDVRAMAVLLTADDSTAAHRLAQREIGSGLQDAIGRSAAAAANLESAAMDTVHRVFTDNREVSDIAAQVISMSGWV
jgi:predicted kinase